VYAVTWPGHADDPFPVRPDREVYPVAGVVRWRGGPAERATVYLHPIGNADPAHWPNGYPRATVAADGTFAVSTFRPKDGAPAGRYAALVRWPKRADRSRSWNDDEGREDRFGGRYLRPAQSRWVIDVRPGPPTHVRMDLGD
jgi:hypothetical protein